MSPKVMNILFVDDDEVMAQSVEMALRANGHVCEIAGLGERAVALCTRNDYDIAVLDVGLPDIDGYHVVRRLKTEGVETPVLLQTGQDDPDFRANAASLGVKGFFTKPFSIAELLERMEQVLARDGIDAPACESRASDAVVPAAKAHGEVPGRGRAERRRHERKVVVEAAMIVDGGNLIACVIVNLSESGAGLLLSDADLDCSETFTLQPLNGEARRCTRRWREGAKMGLEFS